MKKILFLLVVVFAGYNSQAQLYRHALGLRGISTVAPLGFGGNGVGATFKTFLNENAALDLTLSGSGYYDAVTASRVGWFVLTGLFEVHKPQAFLDNFSFYYGGGIHVGASSGGGFSGGFDGVFGAEWVFPFAPQFAVSADVIPAISFSTTTIWGSVSPTVGAKWLFAK